MSWGIVIVGPVDQCQLLELLHTNTNTHPTTCPSIVPIAELHDLLLRPSTSSLTGPSYRMLPLPDDQWSLQ